MGISSWWNAQWKIRRLIKTTTGSPHTSGVHFLRVDADLAQFISNGVLRSDYADLRVICQKADHNINVPFYIAENPDPQRIFFAAQHDIDTDENIGDSLAAQHYYLYYNNTAGYSGLEPEPYVNINFPQAPYSVHTDGYDTPDGKYFDRHFFRLNDDPSNGPKLFTDATERANGLSKDYTHVQKGHSGILDQSTFFDGVYHGYNPESGSWIHIPGDPTDIAVPSGNWAIDFWLKIHPKSQYSAHYGTPFSHALGSGAEFDDPYPSIYHNFIRTSNLTYTYTQCNFSYQFNLLQREDVSARIPSGEWHHFRVAYRTGGGHQYSRIHMYHNGRVADLYEILSTDSQAYAENTSFFGKYDTAPCYIGWRYRLDAVNNYMLTGWLEQLRYSSFVFPAISGTADPADPYHCAPDWVSEQYVGTLGAATTALSASGFVGGIVRSIGVDTISGIFGGFTIGRYKSQGDIGGVTLSVSATTSGSVGGFLRAAVLGSGSIGSISLGSYGDIEINRVEGLNRVLIKADSDNVINQDFKSDAMFTFYGSSTDSFDASIQTELENKEEFDSKIIISKIRFNPEVYITNVEHSYSGYIPAKYTLTASGHAYNVNNEPIQSGIHYVVITWGDNDYSIIDNPITSGSIWQAQHIYSHSGLYKPVILVRDKYGRSGSDTTTLNFASGIDIPYISLSGQPRSGYAPPPLSVDFNASVSGTLGSYTIYWDFGNGISYFNNFLTQTIDYPMPGNYIPIVRIEDERGVYVSDTLLIGYNI